METKVRRIQFGTQPRFILFIYNRFDLACGAMAGQMKLDIRWAISGSSLSVIHAHGSDTVRALEQKIVPQVGAGNAVKLVFEGRVLAPQERVSEVLENNAVLDVICRRSQVFTASMDGNIKVWGTSQGECQATLTGHQGPVTSLALSADNQYLVSGSEDCTARIWNLETLECQHVLAPWPWLCPYFAF